MTKHEAYIRYYLAIVIGILLVFALWIGLIHMQVGVPTNESAYLHRLITFKEEILHKTPGPRIIILAGSNADTSLSARMIEQSLGIPTINMSLVSTLNLEYILYWVRQHAQPGDTILMPLEYEHYTRSLKPTGTLVSYVMSYDLDYLDTLSSLEQIRFFFSVPDSRLIHGVRQFVQPEPLDWESIEKELRHSYDPDKNGDYERTNIMNITEETWQEVFDLGPNKVVLRGIPPDSADFTTLRLFAEWCKANGIQLLATFPTTIYYPAYDLPDYRDDFDSLVQFYDSINVSVLGTPRDFMYDKHWFFDSRYHLHNVGRIYHTARIITMLQPYVTVSGITTQGATVQR